MATENTTEEHFDSSDPRAEYGEIWKTLASIDVSDQIKKKGNLSYLSWAWAWGRLMDHYPDASYVFLPEENVNETTMVTCKVWIGSCQRTMWLPVMDNRNNAIVQPGARDISDARMRCLVKCLAMFGLGHYIYAGEDLPQDTSATKPAGPIEKAAPERTEADIERERAVKLTILTFLEDIEDTDDLRVYWSKNAETLKDMSRSNPEFYEEILGKFKAKKAELASK